MIIDNYAAKVYNGSTLYHWHCVCPICNNITRYLSLDMNIMDFPKCDKCGGAVNKIINPVGFHDCECLKYIDNCLRVQ